MDDFTYRQLPRFANSDLSELSGKVMKAKPETLQFGSAFHELVLEPHKPINGYILTGDQWQILERMQATVRADTELAYLIHRAEKETVRQWIDPLTGLPCKAKIDAVSMPRKRHIIDLKTTACTSQAAFVDSIDQYDYDRQAAFYLSSDPDAEYFEFVGVQKNPPFGLFRVTFHKDGETIVRGRKKMNYLLSLAASHYANPNGWRPSSWSRKPELI